MGYKQTLALSLVSSAVAVSVGSAGTVYVMKHTEHRPVTVEAKVNIDENKLSRQISDNLIKHQEDKEAYQIALSKRNGCIKNRDNEHYLREHCKGVTF